MKHTIQALQKRMEEGKPSMLVTLTENRGSAPRSAGAYMLVGEEGRVAGTIGGGALEFEAIKKARAMLALGRGGSWNYVLTNDRAAELGMVCGGAVSALFSCLGPNPASKAAVARLWSSITEHRTGWLLLPYGGTAIAFYDGTELYGDDPGLPLEGITAIEQGVLEGVVGKCYVQKLENQSLVYMFGGGHLARELMPLLTHLGFRCVVADDRPEYAKQELFPEAERVCLCDYEALSGKFPVKEGDYIIAVTRGHLGDLAVQRFALGTPACYIGVVGSKAKIKAVSERLLAEGFTEADLARVTTPIGIPIQSETPAEIAVSIAAQLIQVRAGLRRH